MAETLQHHQGAAVNGTRHSSGGSVTSGSSSEDEGEQGGERARANWLVHQDATADHAANMLALRREGEFCDVVLEVGQHEYKGHRSVLAAASRFLLDLFRSEPSAPRFRLGGLAAEVFELLLDYAYTARLEVPPRSITDVYRMALKLRMTSAADACSSYLAANLTPDNCLGIRGFANKQSDGRLAAEADGFIRDNLDTVLEAKTLQALPRINIEILRHARFEAHGAAGAQLCVLALHWAHTNVCKYETLQDMAEHAHVLYIDEESGVLEDFKESAGSAVLQEKLRFADHDLAVQDYRRLCRTRQVSRCRLPWRGGALTRQLIYSYMRLLLYPVCVSAGEERCGAGPHRRPTRALPRPGVWLRTCGAPCTLYRSLLLESWLQKSCLTKSPPKSLKSLVKLLIVTSWCGGKTGCENRYKS